LDQSPKDRSYISGNPQKEYLRSLKQKHHKTNMNHKQQQHLIGKCNLVENEFRRLTSFSSPRLSPTSTERKPRLDPLRPFEMAARCLKTQQDKARQAIAQRVGPGLVSVDEPPVIEQGIGKPEVYQIEHR
jgi:hypothetical protein